MTNVTVYSTPTCPWCHKVKEYFDSKGVKYKDIDVSEDHDLADEMVKKSGQMGVPVIEIGEKVIVGFDQKAIDEALEGKAESPKEEKKE